MINCRLAHVVQKVLIKISFEKYQFAEDGVTHLKARIQEAEIGEYLLVKGQSCLQSEFPKNYEYMKTSCPKTLTLLYVLKI